MSTHTKTPPRVYPGRKHFTSSFVTAPGNGKAGTMDTPDLISEAVERAMSVAVVDVYDIEFKDVLSAKGTGVNARGTGHRMKMRASHDRVSVDSQGNLHIKPRGATIEFAILSPDYFPVGIAFAMLSGLANPDDAERLGRLNFSQATISPYGHSLCVTDQFKDKEGDDRYKFSIIIQRGSDGRIGIIDPIFIHEPR